jgi:hypothetical protein
MNEPNIEPKIEPKLVGALDKLLVAINEHKENCTDPACHVAQVIQKAREK